jgi:ADP-ribosylglycohydrolase
LGTFSSINNKSQLTQEQQQKKATSVTDSIDTSKETTLASTEIDDTHQRHQHQMQAYHQSFNPQAYISNTNGAAAAVAAAAYYQHHNPANYVIPSQYSIADGFGYGAGNPTSVAAAAALAVGSPQAYNAQQVIEIEFFYSSKSSKIYSPVKVLARGEFENVYKKIR